MRAIELLERLNVLVGRTVAWLTLLMVLVTFLIVIMRYLFDSGWIWLQESVNWMHAAVFMLAAAYTFSREEHVRVDIFYRHFSPRVKAIVDAGGTLLLLMPVTVFLLVESWAYVVVSWEIREASAEAGGLVYPFPSLMKSLIPLMALMLMFQGVVVVIRSLWTFRQEN